MSTATLEPNEAKSCANDQWSLAQAQKKEKPLLIRYRSARPHGVQPTDFPFLLSATWSYQPNEHGLPSTEEMELMDKFEEALTTSLEGSQTAHLMVVLTNNGERDWLWYTCGEERAMSQVNKALKGHKRYPVQFSVQKDRTWQAHSQFLDNDDPKSAYGESIIWWAINKVMHIFRQ